MQGRPSGNAVTTRFVWEGYRLLQEIHDGTPLTYVYSDSQSYEPLARIDGVESPEIYWFHNAANGMPELLTDGEGQKVWEGINSPWGKLLRESSQRMPVVQQNLRMQGQYLDRETGLHYNLFRYYDPDSGRFTQQDPIGLAGGINLYQYAPNALGWVDPWGLSKCETGFLYRGDKRAPNVIFREGFKPLGDSLDLLLHARDNRSPPSHFVSTSSDIEVAQNFAARDEQKGFVYAIRAQQNAIDVNKALGKDTPFPDEVEMAVPGGISSKDILGVTPVNGDGSFVGFSFINFFGG